MAGQPAMADVEISIVSLGDEARLGACLESLPAACAGLAWRLTVVDNSPTGMDLTAAPAPAPSTMVIRSVGRRGFGANQNLALTGLVREDRARYALILNDDTELDPEAVTALVRHADANRRAGIVGPRIRDARGSREPSFLPWPSVREQAARAAFPRTAARRTHTSGWLNGACLLVRTTALRQVGLFDPSFFLFFEDADLSLRVARAGWDLELCEEASLVHHGHQTITEPALGAEAEKQLLRSRFLFFRKHRGRAAAVLVTEIVRCVLMVRAAKRQLETARARRPRAGAPPNRLWTLARSSPARPTRLEREAEADT